MNYQAYLNRSNIIAMIMQGNHVLICESEIAKAMINFINEKHSNLFHLSEQKTFLSNIAIAMRTSLPQQITDKINRM